MDILATSIQAALPAATAPAVTPVPSAPDSLAAQRFAQIMNAAPAGAVEAPLLAPTTAPVSAVQPGEALLPASGVQPSMGERILSGMQGVSSDFQAAWKSVSATLDSEQPLAMQDLLKLQLNLTQISVQYELVGKAVSRSTQNFDQLVRVQ